MRLRNVTGSREVIADSPFVIHEPDNFKGRFARDVFHNDREIHIEIGMGKGQFLMELASRNPSINYVGIEKYSSVLLRAIQKMEQLPAPLPNLVFIRMDAEDICDVFAQDEVSKIYLNFSDPWPKDRHAKRRLPSREFLHRYEQILVSDGVVEFKTDNQDLFSFALTEAPEAKWEIVAQTRDLHHDDTMNEGNIMTEYEAKFSSQGNPICKCILKKMFLAFLLIMSLSLQVCLQPVQAVNTVPTEEQAMEAEQRKLMRVESNEISGWPEGPLIGAQSAILMEADTGVILYEKNIHEHLYPASTTKLMTALLALENSSMEDIVTFSNESIHNIESTSSRIGIDVGEELTMEQCLYGLLLASGNEVAYAISEYIGGSVEQFVDMMNSRAEALGCTDTHFANANGLPRPDHYTSAYDLALIAKECFQNESLATIAGSTSYTIPPTNKQKQDRPLDNHHLMLPGFKYAYEGMICGKTGYTQDARQTLVTLAQRGDLRLICVIMKEEAPDQFLDTQKLFDYGFNQFQKVNVAENEKKYSLDSATFFHTNLDIIGSSKPILSINPNGSVVIPKISNFEDAAVSITYSSKGSDSVATLNYSIDNHFVGDAAIDYANLESSGFDFANIITDSGKVIPEKVSPDHKIIFVDTNRLVLTVSAAFVGVLILIALIYGIRRIIKSERWRLRREKKRYKKWNKRLF